MDVGLVKVAEDSDFSSLKELIEKHTGWKLEFSKPAAQVWTKNLPQANFKMVKVIAEFNDISADTVYDVLHDPEYRKVWDQHMIDSHDIGYLNPNNDVGYYSMSCPTPLDNRDFVLQRSWLDLGDEKYILNHSVYHKNYPPRKGYIRATSHLTGFLVRKGLGNGCTLGYISQTDPQGTLPPWLVNRVTHIFGPKMVKNLQKASATYVEWKKTNNPFLRPWIYPEQISAPKLDINDCVKSLQEEEMNKKESRIKESLEPLLHVVESRRKSESLTTRPVGIVDGMKTFTRKESRSLGDVSEKAKDENSKWKDDEGSLLSLNSANNNDTSKKLVRSKTSSREKLIRRGSKLLLGKKYKEKNETPSDVVDQSNTDEALKTKGEIMENGCGTSLTLDEKKKSSFTSKIKKSLKIKSKRSSTPN